MASWFTSGSLFALGFTYLSSILIFNAYLFVELTLSVKRITVAHEQLSIRIIYLILEKCRIVEWGPNSKIDRMNCRIFLSNWHFFFDLVEFNLYAFYAIMSLEFN